MQVVKKEKKKKEQSAKRSGNIQFLDLVTSGDLGDLQVVRILRFCDKFKTSSPKHLGML